MELEVEQNSPNEKGTDLTQKATASATEALMRLLRQTYPDSFYAQNALFESTVPDDR